MFDFKKSSTLLFVIIITFVFIGCSDKSTDPQPDTPTVPDNNVQNINKEEVPQQSNGGDPRGKYFANSPIYFHFSSTLTVQDSIVVSRGKYMLKIEGSSSTQGTYSYIFQSIEIEQHIKLTSSSSTANIDIKQNINNTTATEEKGSWSVSGNIIQFTPQGSAAYEHDFTANNRGLYYYSEMMVPLMGNYTRVRIFKKE